MEFTSEDLQTIEAYGNFILINSHEQTLILLALMEQAKEVAQLAICKAQIINKIKGSE